MGDKTTIPWCNYTFNPWIGCAKVTDACKFCYAEKYADRWDIAKWGLHGTRHITSDANWKKPIVWNKKAVKENTRYSVFCASLADIAEDRPDLVEPRTRLCASVDQTPNLDWLFLSKRPENFEKVFPPHWLAPGGFPKNVWLGVTIANQADYDEMMRPLVEFCTKYPVQVMFMSAEPLLGKIEFHSTNKTIWQKQLDWIIIGGESGPITKVRKLDLYHVQYIFDQFKHEEFKTIPKLFFKQIGSILAKTYKLKNSKGEDITELPPLLRPYMRREWPASHDGKVYYHDSTHAA